MSNKDKAFCEMKDAAGKKLVLRQLQQEMLALQGLKKPEGDHGLSTGIRPMEQAFPGGIFPTGTVHEFISMAGEEAAATHGFIAALLGKLLRQGGMCLWVGTERTIFPPALNHFGLAPHQVVFVDAARQKDALWAIEEGLKCDSLAAVVGDLKELSFTESRRLQLMVEQSRVTGFIHRCRPRSENTVACVARWKIRPLSSETREGMPGPGHPRWHARLLKVRNGKPGAWEVEWTPIGFRLLSRSAALPQIQKRKYG
jgi:protein ImuA